jgi:hypothetical protein
MILTQNPTVMPTVYVVIDVAFELKAQAEAKFHMYCIGLR